MAKRTRWIIGLAVLTGILTGPAIVELAQLSLRQYQLDRQLEALRREHERLVAQRERLETDSTYVEGLIRSTFKQARRGEYVIPLAQTPSSPQTSAGAFQPNPSR